ncbi:DUF6597 domain-containing transcriptional factor [Zhouia sp. PK063]|uniref:DUF6597 domain-containing transcriptional factor n=1 Tax=Zhouia sp. PK063 TaxID=3373602 RepID=UPI003790CFC6
MTLSNGITYLIQHPEEELSLFVDSFWMLRNDSDFAKEIVVLPDGRSDVFFSFAKNEKFHATVLGLSTAAEAATVLPKSCMFAVSFTLLGVEYILQKSIAALINIGEQDSHSKWNIEKNDIVSFDKFSKKLSFEIKSKIPENLDTRKQKLFALIYKNSGNITVEKLSTEIGWSTRQMSRYFNQWFGLSVKSYLDILRYRASFTSIKEGKLFPEQDFSDQAHFIREIKKYSGVTPKQLYRNEDDLFIQLSTLE